MSEWARARSLFEEGRAEIDRRFGARDPSIRVFVHPMGQEFLELQAQRFQEIDTIFPEDYANFRWVHYFFQRYCPADRLQDADFVFVPLFLPIFEEWDVDLDRLLGQLPSLASEKQHLLFTSGDTYPRPIPPSRRRNPFCAVATIWRGRDQEFVDLYRWLDDRFTLLCYEYTVDREPRDIGLLPARPTPRELAPPARRLLLGFYGTDHYPNLPPEHIRGTDNQRWWRALRESPDQDIAVNHPTRLATGHGLAMHEVPSQLEFCLCPAGWARWSFRLTEAILHHSIPVILSDHYELPFDGYVDWARLAVRVPERELPRVVDIVRSVSPQRRREYREYIAANAFRFTPAGMLELLARELSRRKGSP